MPCSNARAGSAAAAFDFPGHGDNPVPMSAERLELTGATRQLMTALDSVIGASLRLTGGERPVALLGHSMASDIIVRQALRDPRVGALVAVSMYSEAVTATAPDDLPVITGEFEPGLRRAALEALRLVAPSAGENDIAVSDFSRPAMSRPGCASPPGWRSSRASPPPSP